ncbi:hypothetical protein HYV86_02550 [Candidatus Woesearchaeota archaeon]|nr:hypothetical protein [Candidatus Woesearchaeota archaeon]
MQRKIIAQGLGGRTIFLPIKWVRENDLKPGEEITLIEKGSNLVLCAQKPAHQKIAINISSEHDRTIRIQLQNVYRLGYDNIEIKYINAKQRRTIQDLVEKYFLGFEIIEEKENLLLIRAIAESHATSHETMLQRMFYIIAETFIELKLSIEANSAKSESIKEYAEKITKYDNFLRRIISTKKLFDDKTYLYWSLSTYLNLIERNLIHLYEQLPLDKKATPKTKELLLLLESTFSEMKKGFLTKQGKEIESASEKINKALNSSFLPALTTSLPRERIAIYYCAELSRLLYLISSPLYGILCLEKSET